MDLEFLPEAMKIIRVSHARMTQTQLAEEMRVNHSFLSEIESGIKSPSLQTLAKFSEVAEIPIWKIFKLSELIRRERSWKKVRRKMGAILNEEN